MDTEDEDLLVDTKPISQSVSYAVLRTIISLALFVAVDYLIFKSWSAVILLVSVIFLHESGHFIAMKVFGYKSINMTFVPFMGAYVSGEATHFSKYKKIIMLFAGPLPGIIIGMGLLFLYAANLNEYFYLAGVAFLLLNLFNLVPLSPLDGGQIVETLFPRSGQFIQIVFLCLSLLVVIYLSFLFQSWLILLIAWFILMHTRSVYLVYKIRTELNELHIPYNIAYEDLTDSEYTEIRDVLIAKHPSFRKKFTPGLHSVMEDQIISYMGKILMPAYYYDLTVLQKIIFIIIYLLAFILPAIQWLIIKGGY